MHSNLTVRRRLLAVLLSLMPVSYTHLSSPCAANKRPLPVFRARLLSQAARPARGAYAYIPRPGSRLLSPPRYIKYG